MVRSTTSQAAPNPYKRYDRPSSSIKLAAGSSTLNQGAPRSLGQSSRKGKKAWRKNIDITPEESALEQAREEERATGYVR